MECLKQQFKWSDAVYLGGEMFGARAMPGILIKEELFRSTDYVHLYGKNYFLQSILWWKKKNFHYCRILKPLWARTGCRLYRIWELYLVIRKHFETWDSCEHPDDHRVHGARIARKMGAKRVVPARELSFGRDSEIKDDTGLWHGNVLSSRSIMLSWSVSSVLWVVC